MNEFNILDKKIGSISDYNLRLNEAYNNGDPLVCTFVNPYSYPILSNLSNVVSRFNLVLSDGVMHTKLHNMFYPEKIERVSFDLSSIALEVLARAQEKGLSIAFIGTKSEYAKVLPKKLYDIFPNLNICYCRDGFFNSDMERLIIHEIDDSCPDILVVGMGTPLQEEFLLKCVDKLTSVKEFYTCGGFLEQTAVKGDYYPKIIKKTGLRWLYRALKHSHVRKRLVKEYPAFLYVYLKWHFKRQTRIKE